MAKLLEKLNEGIIFHTINDDKKSLKEVIAELEQYGFKDIVKRSKIN